MKPLKNPQRFWSKVDVRGPDDCWNWTSCTVRGYGVIWHDGNNKRAPRVSYFLTHGDIPDDKIVLHSCDNPACVNPVHLSLGTHTENIAERHARGRTARGASLPQTKLGEDARAAILADARSQRTLAAIYGVHQSTIRNVRRAAMHSPGYLRGAVENIAGRRA